MMMTTMMIIMNNLAQKTRNKIIKGKQKIYNNKYENFIVNMSRESFVNACHV